MSAPNVKSETGRSTIENPERLENLVEESKQREAEEQAREEAEKQVEDRLAAALAEETVDLEIAGVEEEFHLLDSPGVERVADDKPDSEYIAVLLEQWNTSGDVNEAIDQFEHDAQYVSQVLGRYSTDDSHNAEFWRENMSITRRIVTVQRLLGEGEAVNAVDEATARKFR